MTDTKLLIKLAPLFKELKEAESIQANMIINDMKILLKQFKENK